ncbi:MAG: hypothetical protein M3239_08240 [Thermoproteota archaeon]|nr:hypothetical protein [Thermoproteota archaeon]
MVVITNAKRQIPKAAPSYLAATKIGLATDMMSKFVFFHFYRTIISFKQALQENIVGSGLG